ncbi:MAG: glycogen-binding domain-containing protein [bacterium]|nr:glycogen-binding domain-containing protein [bacterium]
MNLKGFVISSALFIPMLTAAAPSDSVDVTFRYSHAGGRPAVVYLAGEFNRWGNNVGGVISDPSAAMTYDETEGVWVKTVRLRVGGPDPLPDPGRSVAGAYQYKFNENGASSG